MVGARPAGRFEKLKWIREKSEKNANQGENREKTIIKSARILEATAQKSKLKWSIHHGTCPAGRAAGRFEKLKWIHEKSEKKNANQGENRKISIIYKVLARTQEKKGTHFVISCWDKYNTIQIQ